MSEAPERIGIISNGLGLWALAQRDEASWAVHYIRADVVEKMVGDARKDRDYEC